MNFIHILLIEIISIITVSSDSHNISCYQCIKNSSEECGPEHLLPCPKVADRCVTHISKHVDKGYLIKRECGLGPCGFEDDMVNKGLGMDGCDRNKDDYFCVFCCKTDGCNRNGSSILHLKPWLIYFILFLIIPLVYCPIVLYDI